MDLVSNFSYEGKLTKINVQGTNDKPLFQASQVGNLLELSNIRESIKDFDETEKCTLEIIGPCGGMLNATFLTEVGLYRLLCSSRKPIAKIFKKWIVHVLVEARQNATLQAQRVIAEATTQARLAIEEVTRALETEREAAAGVRAELERYRTITYDEVRLDDNLYINKERSESHNKKHKVGKSKNVGRRLRESQTASASGVVNLYQRACFNAPICEKMINVVMQRYHISSNGGTEHYNNEYQHTIDVVDSAAVYIDTVASTTEHMTRQDFFAKLIENFKKEGETPNRITAPYWETEHDHPLRLTNGGNAEEEVGGDLTNNGIENGALGLTPEVSPLFESEASTSTMQPNTRATEELIDSWLNRVIEFTGNKNSDKVHFHDARINEMRTTFVSRHPTVRCEAADLVLRIKTFINQRNSAGVVWKDSTKVKDVEGRQIMYNNVACGVRLRMRDM